MPDETRQKELDSGGRGWTRTRLDGDASGRVWWICVGEIDAITAVFVKAKFSLRSYHFKVKYLKLFIIANYAMTQSFHLGQGHFKCEGQGH